MRSAKVILLSILSIFVLVMAFSSMGGAKPSYVGAKKCKMCHKTKKKGEQYPLWKKRGHSRAYETLKNDESKAIAKKMGLGDPLKEEKCLKCHVMNLSVSDTLKTEGVSCEACHGPGSLYKKTPIMKDREKAKTLGLIEADEKLCLKCHNEESPTFKKFVFDEMVKKIAHPLPKK